MGCVATLVVLKTTAVHVNNWDLRIFDRFTESTTIRHPLTIRQKKTLTQRYFRYVSEI